MRPLTLSLIALLHAAPAAAQAAWVSAPPTSIVQLGSIRDTMLSESSAAAASRRQPGVIWTLNDSGNPPWVHAIDTTGRVLGAFRITGAQNFDWETLTLSPCPAGSCLVIGDTGDNPERRPEAVLYRVPEPEVVRAGSTALEHTPPAESLLVRYPDHAHDIEAIYADASGTIHLITKGRSGGILHFRLPASAWGGPAPAVAERLDSLPILPDWQGAGRVVTDAALSPDGSRVAIRTYGDVYFFRVGEGGHLSPDQWKACHLGLALEPQGEGITWLDEQRLLLISESSETVRGTVIQVECGAP